MRDELLKKRNVVPIGSREWLERIRASQEPDWHKVLPPTKSKATSEPIVPDNVRQHLRETGRRGGLQRARNYALRSIREGAGFWRRYHYSPDKVTARPVTATREVREQLRILASRGGQARACKCSREQLKAIAAMGGRAKAAKFRQPALPAQPVAGKQE